ncbi:MAG: hypothetical protein JRJ47_12720 [Deltaproteobacteria bacterium]|nr:hypothetical protein [Deltaproteobacteria bacterium]
MVTKRDYTEEAVNAARSVLVELMHLLGEYREDIVVVGGWVPELLFGQEEDPHVGSIDIDLALNHVQLKDEGYKSIQKLLLDRGYVQGRQPFIFHRKVPVDAGEIDVEVDLLSGEYEGTGKSRRHQKVQEGVARKARGCDLAFIRPVILTVQGILPGGAKDSAEIRVASIVPFLVMKGMALDDRLKEKDAWDIYYCLKHYGGGLDGLVKEIEPYLKHGLVIEGLQKIAEHFATEEHTGPKHVADFEELTDPEEREIRERDAFERVNHILQKLGIEPPSR